MTKLELIEKLQAIPGNPRVFLIDEPDAANVHEIYGEIEHVMLQGDRIVFD